VYDGDGVVLGSQNVPSPGGALLLSVGGVKAGRSYHVAVQATGGPTPSQYELALQVNAPAFPLPVAATGALTATAPQAFRGFELPRGGVIHLDAATQAPAGLSGAVEVAVFDQQGNVVFRQVVSAGQTLSANLLLGPGAYTIRLVGATQDGSALPNLPFTISSQLLSDPIGPQLIDPTNPPPLDATPVWFTTGFFDVLALTDPYGRPISPLQPLPPVAQVPPS